MIKKILLRIAFILFEIAYGCLACCALPFVGIIWIFSGKDLVTPIIKAENIISDIILIELDK
jgi:hypothetical protein